MLKNIKPIRSQNLLAYKSRSNHAATVTKREALPAEGTHTQSSFPFDSSMRRFPTKGETRGQVVSDTGQHIDSVKQHIEH